MDDTIIAVRVEAEHLTTATSDVTDDRAELRLRARDLELHDRLEETWLGVRRCSAERE